MGRYKLIEWYERSLQDEPGAFELYDLIRDPGEQNNLAERLPKLTARLKAELKSWKEEVGAQFIRKR